jgi:spheroidene monooxygenase
MLGGAPAVAAIDVRAAHLRLGMAEFPGFQQITFSIWDDFEAMRAFAYRKGGPHAKAVEAVRREGWFHEELYARFRVEAVEGAWSACPQLDAIRADAAMALAA